MYCPRCGAPLTPTDEDCLCDTCGLFFDASEALDEPPPGAGIIRSVGEIMDLYQDICRKQQLLETLFLRGEAANTDLLRSEQMRRQSKQAIIEMFIKLLENRLPKEPA